MPCFNENIQYLFNIILFVVFLFQATTNVFSSFAFLHYKQVSEQNQNLSPTYGVGLMDLFTIFFYLLLILVFRSIIQELVLVVSLLITTIVVWSYFVFYKNIKYS